MKLLFVLGVLLILQNLVAVFSEELTEDDQVMVLKIKEYAKLINYVLHQYQEIFKATIKDIESKPPVSEDIQNRLKEFKDFNTDVDNLPKDLNHKFLDEVFGLHQLAAEIINRNYDQQNESSDELIHRTLRDNGMKVLSDNSDNMEKNFQSKLQQQIKDWKALPEPERKLDANVVEWYKRYKAGEIKKVRILDIIEIDW